MMYFQMVDWVAVNKSLPYKRTVEEKALRRKMWQGIDVNANGFVSLAEITKVRRRRRQGRKGWKGRKRRNKKKRKKEER